MDPLKPVYIRLKQSTVDALRVAQSRSTHRTMASFIDDILRRHLSVDPPQTDRIDQLTKSSREMQ